MPILNTKWENDEFLIDDEEIEVVEIDEDEEYVKQTTTIVDEEELVDEDDSYDPYEEDDGY